MTTVSTDDPRFLSTIQACAVALRRLAEYEVEQDHRGVKRVTRPMLGFKSFEAAQPTLTGIELIHMLRKGQLGGDGFESLTAAEQFYALAL